MRLKNKNLLGSYKKSIKKPNENHLCCRASILLVSAEAQCCAEASLGTAEP